jgi:hypothetical protein
MSNGYEHARRAALNALTTLKIGLEDLRHVLDALPADGDPTADTLGDILTNAEDLSDNARGVMTAVADMALAAWEDECGEGGSAKVYRLKLENVVRRLMSGDLTQQDVQEIRELMTQFTPTEEINDGL